MKNLFFKYMLVAGLLFCTGLLMAQPEITSSKLIEFGDNPNSLKFEGSTNEPARMYVAYTDGDGALIYTNISDIGTEHGINIMGVAFNTLMQITAYAFNAKGITELALETVEMNVEALEGLQPTVVKKNTFVEPILLHTNRGNGAEDVAFVIDSAGNTIWYDVLPNSNENADCNTINYQNGYVLISDCHTITRKKLNGTDEMTYTLEGDSLYDGSFFHDKAIINQNGNVVSLFAHKRIVDRTLVGGDLETVLVADGFAEFDFETGELLYTYSPTSDNTLCQFFGPLAEGGKWVPIFGDSIKFYRLATEINQDFDGNYFLTFSKDTFSRGGITKVNPTNDFCEIEASEISTANENLVLYEDDFFANPRSFSILPNGNYFMLTNYPDFTVDGIDTIISPLGNGTDTRALKYYLEFGYMGYLVMFWTADEYQFPTTAYTELGSATWLPNDNILGFSDTQNTLYEINDNSEVIGELKFMEAVEEVALVGALMTEVPDVFIASADTIVCSDRMEFFELKGEPIGGYFNGAPISDGNIFYPDSVDVGTYTIVYNYGPYSANLNITVEQCVGIEELEAMGGLESNLYPNPVTSDNPMLKYRQIEAGNLQFISYTLSGKLVEQINLGNRSMGLSMETIDCSHYSNGVYIYKLVSGEMEQVKRFVVAR